MPTVQQYAPCQQANATGTGATTIVSAGPAGTNYRYRDIVKLIITTANLVASTLTISDGTKTVGVFNYPNAALAPGTPLVLDFDPPLEQSGVGNAAWTITPSVNASSYNITAQFTER